MMIYREGEQQIQRDSILECVSLRLRAPAEAEIQAAEMQAMCQMRQRVRFSVWMNSKRQAWYSVEAV